MPDINAEKVTYVIAKARQLESATDVFDSADDEFLRVVRSNARQGVRAELEAFIDAMGEDEQCELVALTWVGRGRYTREEWNTAVAEVRARRAAAAPRLLEDRLLASHLEYG